MPKKINCFRNCIGLAAVVTVALLLFASCGGNGNKRSDARPVPNVASGTMHFWDKVDFSNRSLTGDADFMEQHFANYVALLSVLPADSAKAALTRFVGQAATDSVAVDVIAGIAAKYLYDYNSPLRNEDLYIAFADAFLSSPQIPEIAKVRTEYLRDLSAMNRPGMKANDFEFELTDGTRHRLCEPSSGKTMLMFFDIDCEVCADILAEMKASADLKKSVQNGELRVLAVYVAPDEDGAANNKERWRSYAAANMPAEWEVAIPLTDLHDIYDLRVLPVRYLLSPDCTVIRKDM